MPKILAAAGIFILFIARPSEGFSQDRAGSFSEVREKILGLIGEKTVPSLSLAVVKNGEIIWEEAFGLASLEKQVKAFPETLYPIASATKPFTATALMILVERGLVNLDKPANDYLGRTKLRTYEGEASPATARRILHPTTGIPMYWRFYNAGSSRQRPPFEPTLERSGWPFAQPGERPTHSNP